MANPETIINSIRTRCTEVFEICQKHLSAVVKDRDDFIAELGIEFFTDWFDTVVGCDVTFAEVVDAIAAMETLLATFENVRSKLQAMRTR